MIQQTDAFGRLTSVCEVYSGPALQGFGGTPGACGLDIGATGFLTAYSYDTLNNLKTATQGPQVRTFGYDSFSRMISESHPEWSVANGSPATTTYAYNSDGLLSSRIRPAPNGATGSITTNYTYDELHRLIMRSYVNDPTGTQPASYSYDLATSGGFALSNTIGRLSTESVTNTAGGLFGYDVMGRVIKNWQCVPQQCASGSYLLQYSYDLLGNVLTSYDGVGVTFTYAYNNAARLSGMTSNYSDATHPPTLLSSVHYGPFGPTTSTLGNGVAESFGYNTYGATKSYTASSGGVTRYSFSIPDPAGFAPNWNVLSANDSVNGNWTYTYDPFNRLLSSNKSGAVANYNYDRFGNRLSQTPAPSYIFDSANHIVGSGVGYDAMGNQTSDGFNSYTYDAENRLVTSISGANGATTVYAYDAEGRRLHTSNYEVLFDLAGRPFSTLGAYPSLVPNYLEIYAGGRHLATYSYNTTDFIHTDWLGTKRAMTNVSGVVSETSASFPFGDGLSNVGTEWNFMHLSDDTHDGESNLDHAAFRQYSNTQGRFTTPDPFLGSMNITNPQSLNRYSYVMNSPMNWNDPSGLGPDNGPFTAAGCTLLSGNGDEAFGCAGINNITLSGGGFSLGILGPGFGGGFSGIPIPGCLLPGACNISLPAPSLGSLLPQLPDPQCDFGPCGGSGFVGAGIGSLPGLGNIQIDPLFIFTRTLDLFSSTCVIPSPFGKYDQLSASYGHPGCLMTGLSAPLGQNGKCVPMPTSSGGSKNCYQYGCYTYCPKDTFKTNLGCGAFIDPTNFEVVGNGINCPTEEKK